MGKYKVEITGIDTNKLKVLKNNETIELFKKYQKGDKLAKEEIVNGNLKLVLSIIKHYNSGKYDMNDLFQIGTVGLIKAVDNFSLEYDVKFSTYAVPLILGEVKRFIRESCVVRISRSIKDTAYQILKFKESYMLKNGIEPSNKQICHELNITEYDLSLALESLIEPVSISEPIYNDGGDTIYLEDQLSNQKDMIDSNDTISLTGALNKINKREYELLELIRREKKIPKDDFSKSATINSLLEKKYIKEIYDDEKAPSFSSFYASDNDNEKLVQEILDSEEKNILVETDNNLKEFRFAIDIAKETLKRNKSILIISPNISLANPFIEFLNMNFKDNLVILSSNKGKE